MIDTFCLYVSSVSAICHLSRVAVLVVLAVTLSRQLCLPKLWKVKHERSQENRTCGTCNPVVSPLAITAVGNSVSFCRLGYQRCATMTLIRLLVKRARPFPSRTSSRSVGEETGLARSCPGWNFPSGADLKNATGRLRFRARVRESVAGYLPLHRNASPHIRCDVDLHPSSTRYFVFSQNENNHFTVSALQQLQHPSYLCATTTSMLDVTQVLCYTNHDCSVCCDYQAGRRNQIRAWPNTVLFLLFRA